MRKLFLLLLILTAPVLLSGSASASDGEKAVTVMIYMSGCDLESGTGAATTDMVEMARSGFDREQVNVVLFTGGATRWNNAYIPADQNGLYVVEGVRNPTEAARFDPMNMGDPDTLRFFLETCRTQWPAEDYVLIFWDHGGGPLQGVCVDRVFDNDMLTLAEIRRAFDESGITAEKKLRLIGFDACLMGSLEMATLCAPYADYMVASQELEPGRGWNYAFLRGIGADADGAETGRRIVSSYFEGNGQSVRKGVPLTMACIDLSRIADLNDALAPLFRELADTLSDGDFPEYSIRRQASASVARSSGTEYDLVDLRSLLTQYAELTDTGPALAALDAAVVCQESTVEGLTGLTVYFPLFNKDRYRTGWGDLYASVGSPAAYTDLVNRFGEILTGEALSSWLVAAVRQQPDEPDTFTLGLTPEQQAYFASAALVVLEYDPTTGAYTFVNRYSDVVMDSNGILRARITPSGLFAVDADGSAVSYPLEFERTGDIIALRALVERDIMKYPEGFFMIAVVRLRHNPDTDLWEIMDILAEEDGSPAPIEIDPEDCLAFHVPHFSCFITRDDDGRMLPFDQWDYMNMMDLLTEELLIPSDLAGFRFLPVGTAGHSFFAYYEITDVQHNANASELVPIVNPGTTVLEESRVLIDGPSLRVTLTGIQTDDTEVGAGVTFTYELENLSSDRVTLRSSNLCVNGVLLDMDMPHLPLDPGETHSTACSVSAAQLAYTGITRIRRVSFDLVRKDGEELIPCGQVDFETDLDLSGMIEAKPREVLAAGTAGGLTLEVHDFRVEENGNAVLDVMLRNRTGQALAIDGASAERINACILDQPFALKNIYGYKSDVIPDGADWYGLLTVRSLMDFASELESEDIFASYGIRSISDITLRLGSLSVTASFSSPFDYAAARGREIPEAAYPVAAETDALRVTVESVRAMDTGVLVIFQWENLSEKTVTTPVSDREEARQAAVNGETAGFVSYRGISRQIAPGETARFGCTVYTEDSRSPLPLTSCSLPLHYLSDGGSVFLPPAELSFDPPVTGTETCRSGFTVRQGPPVSEGEPQLIREEITVPDGAGGYARRFRPDLSEAQLEAFERGSFNIVLITGDRMVLFINQPLVRDENGRPAAVFPGLLPCLSDGPGQDEPVFTIVRADGGKVTYTLAGLVFEGASLQFYNSEVTLEQVPGGDEIRLVSVTTDPPLSGRQEDFGSVYNFHMVFKMNERDPLPGINEWENLSGHYRMFTTGAQPLPLHLYVPEEADNLRVLYSITNKDGTTYALPPIPYFTALTEAEGL